MRILASRTARSASTHCTLDNQSCVRRLACVRHQQQLLLFKGSMPPKHKLLLGLLNQGAALFPSPPSLPSQATHLWQARQYDVWQHLCVRLTVGAERAVSTNQRLLVENRLSMACEPDLACVCHAALAHLFFLFWRVFVGEGRVSERGGGW